MLSAADGFAQAFYMLHLLVMADDILAVDNRLMRYFAIQITADKFMEENGIIGRKRGNIKMAVLNIVMVEPEIPQNTGNVARTCAATGARLHLVEPMGFKIDDKKLKRAGLDYWNLLDISYYKSLDEFFEKNAGPFFYFSTKAQNIYSDVSYPDGAYLVFGKETAGLPEALLHANPASCVRIPMIGGARSLNLSNSVAVGVFEALRQWGFPTLKCSGELTKYQWSE